jgi:hypothetical protein
MSKKAKEVGSQKDQKDQKIDMLQTQIIKLQKELEQTKSIHHEQVTNYESKVSQLTLATEN